jgi:site-specific recombinase XerD
MVQMMDIHNFSSRLESYLKNLNKLDFYSKKKILEFVKYLQAEGISKGRILKYVYILENVAKMLKVKFEKATKDDIIDLVSKIEGNNKWSEWTKHEYKVVIRRFYKWLRNSEDYPPEVKWIKTTLKKSNEKLPEEVLTEEEIKKLSETAYTTRDKAFVLALYESGCRIGEFLPLKIKNLSFDKYGCVLIVSGKTGDRRIRLVASYPALAKWLEEHPDKNNKEAYLWVKLPTPNNPKLANKPLSYGFVKQLLKELATKAGITKKVNPHSFRHARATHLAKILTDSQMKEFFGWSKASDMTSVYVHLSGRDLDEPILKMHGIVTDGSEKPKITVVKCLRCGEENSPSSMFCKKCGTPLDEKTLMEMDKVEDLLIDFFKVLGEIFPQAKEKFIEIAKQKGMLNLFLDKK